MVRRLEQAGLRPQEETKPGFALKEPWDDPHLDVLSPRQDAKGVFADRERRLVELD